MEGFTIATLLESATTLLTWVITSIGSILAMVQSEPILLLSALFVLVGSAFAFTAKCFRSI